MKADRKFLRKIFSLPTAPFHEEHVSHFIREFCRRWKLPIIADRYGNLKVIYRRGRGAKPLAFMAHMDHPGFEVLRGGKQPLAALLGGVNDKHFAKARVVICDGALGTSRLVKGRVNKIHNKKRREFWIRTAQPVAKNSFGWFDLPAIQFKNGLLHTKAADNIASVALLLHFLQALVRGRKRANVTCFFTRAEEVGWIGCLGAIRHRFVPRRIPIVVMETSSAKGGKVDIGGGPCLRVGDRLSLFSPEMDQWLGRVAKNLRKKDRTFQFQRALLQGGACEASPLYQKGYCVGGLALPLGNYHNNGPKNYAGEFISLSDFQNMLKWLVALAVSGKQDRAGLKSTFKTDNRRSKYMLRLSRYCRDLPPALRIPSKKR